MKRPLSTTVAVISACALGLTQSGCGHMSLISLGGPKPAPAPPPVPAKPVCPGNLLADIPPFPTLPAGAGFPAPQDAAASAAVALYGQFLHSLAVYARDGWGHVGDFQKWCKTPQ